MEYERMKQVDSQFSEVTLSTMIGNFLGLFSSGLILVWLGCVVKILFYLVRNFLRLVEHNRQIAEH